LNFRAHSASQVPVKRGAATASIAAILAWAMALSNTGAGFAALPLWPQRAAESDHGSSPVNGW
jgi:hypothetical protein